MFTDFYNHLKKNALIWILALIVLCATQGLWLLSGIIGVDTELFYDTGDQFYGGWMILARYGLVYLNKLFGGAARSPRVIGIFSLIFLEAACILCTFLLSEITHVKSKAANLVFSILSVTAPIVSEQIYYICQSMEITLGFCLIAIVLILVYEFSKKGKIWCLFVSIPFLVITFTEYQAFVALYIVGAAILLYLDFAFDREEKSKKDAVFFGW